MQALYIVEQGARVEKDGGLLCIKAGNSMTKIPIQTIERIIACGNVQFTTQSLSAIAGQAIPITFLSIRGDIKFTLEPPRGKNAPRRAKQFLLCADSEYRLQVCRAIVKAKVHNAYEFIYRHGRRMKMERLNEFAFTVNAILKKIESVENVEALRGIEGFAARVYFYMLGKAFPSPFAFHGRSKRPPRDPVNSLLSLGYTLLANELSALLEAYGFDPYMGFYHTIEYGRMSLGLDLCEEFRAIVVDRLTLYLIKQGIFTVQDFEYEGEACYVAKHSLKRFYEEYEKWMRRDLGFKKPVCLRDLLQRQVERLVKAVENKLPYYPLQYGDDDVYCGEL